MTKSIMIKNITETEDQIGGSFLVGLNAVANRENLLLPGGETSFYPDVDVGNRDDGRVITPNIFIRRFFVNEGDYELKDIVVEITNTSSLMFEYYRVFIHNLNIPVPNTMGLNDSRLLDSGRSMIIGIDKHFTVPQPIIRIVDFGAGGLQPIPFPEDYILDSSKFNEYWVGRDGTKVVKEYHHGEEVKVEQQAA